MVYYNDNDSRLCEWLEGLISDGVLSAGTVDGRSIEEVQDEVRQYRQAHFFAGIGGWPLALELAGWPEEWPVWTGSCPCQPFSVAGKRDGTADERHLWPAFRRLIAECRPPVVFGEQVASKDGRLWLAGVRADLEALGYAVGCADLCAAGVGAPHIRQRLWWVAIAERGGQQKQWRSGQSGYTPEDATPSSENDGLANPESIGRRRRDNGNPQGLCGAVQTEGRGTINGLADLQSAGQLRAEQPQNHRAGSSGRSTDDIEPGGKGTGGMGNATEPGRERDRPEDVQGESRKQSAESGFWSDYDLIPCLDGKARRTQPGVHPLAHGVSGRVVKLRAYGNAICPQVAAEFIKTTIEYLTREL